MDLQEEKLDLEWKISSLKYKESSIKRKLSEPENIPTDSLREFEISNLIRLGLVTFVQETTAGTHSLEIPNSPDKQYLNVDFDIDLDVHSSHIMTELGELFIEACIVHISVIPTQSFRSYPPSHTNIYMALVCEFITSFLNSHLLGQIDVKNEQFYLVQHQQ